MKNNIFSGMLRELKDNQKTIERLTKRNKTINDAIKAVELAAGGGGSKETKPRPVTDKTLHPEKGLFNEVFAKMRDGVERNLTEICGLVKPGMEEDPNVRTQLSNACSYLVNDNRFVRIGRGKYRVKFFVAKTEEPEKKVEDVKPTKIDIGHDTHIKQIPATV